MLFATSLRLYSAGTRLCTARTNRPYTIQLKAVMTYQAQICQPAASVSVRAAVGTAASIATTRPRRGLAVNPTHRANVTSCNGIDRSALLAALITLLLFFVLWLLAGAVHADNNLQNAIAGVGGLERGPLAEEFARRVDPYLEIPDASARAYATQLDAALATAHAVVPAPKFIVLIDRNVQVQAAILFWGSPTTGWRLIGAAPVSTGLPGKYEHFLTPLGVFDHARDSPDFRATGSKNQFGIRGYGRKDSRVYDFGWVASLRGWGDHRPGQLRFQMHSTDADRLAQRLGTAQSEGCVRIPAALNEFIDRYGILDQDYDLAVANGGHLWLLRDDRVPTPWSGRYLVVIESLDTTRPAWSPAPVIQIRGTAVSQEAKIAHADNKLGTHTNGTILPTRHD